MNFRRLMAFGALLGLGAVPALASASAPTNGTVPDIFSSRSTGAFKFLASTQAKQLFFVPKTGGVKLDGDLTDPVPEFAASYFVGTAPPFLNKRLLSFGGTLTTSNHLADYTVMKREANAAGYQIAPAPITQARTRVAVLGLPDASTGRVKARCESQKTTQQVTDEEGNPVVDADGKPVMETIEYPVCFVKDPNDPTKEIRTDVLIDYNGIDAQTSDVEADYAFQGTVHPANASMISKKLTNGARWDDVLKVSLDWTISQQGTPRYAELDVDWKSTFTQVWAKAALHNFACLDIQVETLIRDIVTCNDKEKCGVRIKFFDEQGNELPRGVVPPDEEFLKVVTAAADRLRDELANTITDQLGDPGNVNDSRAIFTVRANIQKVTVDRHEVIPIYYFPKATAYKANTVMSVGCLKGAVDQEIKWNMTSSACKKLLQESNVGPGGDPAGG